MAFQGAVKGARWWSWPCLLGSVSSLYMETLRPAVLPGGSHDLCRNWIWFKSSSFLQLDEGSAIFLCKGPDSEYFWLRGPYCLYGNYSLCCCRVKMGTDNAEMNEHGCIPAHLWALKFEFQFFTCHEILDFCIFFNCLMIWKQLLTSYKYRWLTRSGLLFTDHSFRQPEGELLKTEI